MNVSPTEDVKRNDSYSDFEPSESISTNFDSDSDCNYQLCANCVFQGKIINGLYR